MSILSFIFVTVWGLFDWKRFCTGFFIICLYQYWKIQADLIIILKNCLLVIWQQSLTSSHFNYLYNNSTTWNQTLQELCFAKYSTKIPYNMKRKFKQWLSTIQQNKQYWPCYFTVHVYIVIHFCNSMGSVWLEEILHWFFYHLFISVLLLEVQLSRRELGYHQLVQYATFLCMSQARTWFSNVMSSCHKQHVYLWTVVSVS
jgi:hypothetical protein